MSELLYDKLPVGVRKSGDGERYEFGVTIDGGFLAFSQSPVNAFEDDLREAQEKAKAQEAEQADAAQA